MTNTVQTLDQTLTELIQTTVAAAEKGAEFVATEAPIVVEQLLRWHFVEGLLLSAIGLCLLVANIPIWKITAKWCNKNGWTDCVDFPRASVFSSSVLSIVLTIAGLCCMNTTWLKIWIAPKLYLLEYAAELIK